MVVRSETWTCSYNRGDKSSVFVRVRVEGGFKDPTFDRSQVQRVLTENDRVIHLYDTVSDFGTYYATLWDKQKNVFDGDCDSGG